MIDLATETLMSLSQAAATLPAGRGGKKVHLSTILRWILTGVRTPAGRVHLEGIRLGGRWLTSKEALQRFAEHQTPDCSLPLPVPAPRMTLARRRHLEQVEKELDRLGI
jgi:hypothetical protein